MRHRQIPTFTISYQQQLIIREWGTGKLNCNLHLQSADDDPHYFNDSTENRFFSVFPRKSCFPESESIPSSVHSSQSEQNLSQSQSFWLSALELWPAGRLWPGGVRVSSGMESSGKIRKIIRMYIMYRNKKF